MTGLRDTLISESTLRFTLSLSLSLSFQLLSSSPALTRLSSSLSFLPFSSRIPFCLLRFQHTYPFQLSPSIILSLSLPPGSLFSHFLSPFSFFEICIFRLRLSLLHSRSICLYTVSLSLLSLPSPFILPCVSHLPSRPFSVSLSSSLNQPTRS